MLACRVGASSTSDVLQKMKAFDAVYETSFTATGTGVFTGKPGIPSRPTVWKITMDNGTIGITQKATRIPPPDYDKTKSEIRHPLSNEIHYSVPGILSQQITFFGPEFSSQICAHLTFRPDSKGEIVPSSEEKWIVKIYPSDSTALTFYRMKIMFILGRGYSKYIDGLTSVTDLADGTIKCSGVGTCIGEPGRWELVIDPSAAYMVRSATFQSEYADIPLIEITTSEVKWFGERCVPKSSIWADRVLSNTKEEISTTCQFATYQPDIELLRKAEEEVFGPYRGRTLVIDRRSITRVKKLNSGDLYTTLEQLDFDPLESLEHEDTSDMTKYVTAKDNNGNHKAPNKYIPNQGEINHKNVTSTDDNDPENSHIILLLDKTKAVMVLCVTILVCVVYLSYIRSRKETEDVDKMG
jgi:hypothetical protein